jgi:hypothetical protein
MRIAASAVSATSVTSMAVSVGANAQTTSMIGMEMKQPRCAAKQARAAPFVRRMEMPISTTQNAPASKPTIAPGNSSRVNSIKDCSEGPAARQAARQFVNPRLRCSSANPPTNAPIVGRTTKGARCANIYENCNPAPRVQTSGTLRTQLRAARTNAILTAP